MNMEMEFFTQFSATVNNLYFNFSSRKTLCKNYRLQTCLLLLSLMLSLGILSSLTLCQCLQNTVKLRAGTVGIAGSMESLSIHSAKCVNPH